MGLLFIFPVVEFLLVGMEEVAEAVAVVGCKVSGADVWVVPRAE